MLKKHIKNEKGYTIIETMIAVSLFLIIVTIGMGALLNANLIHRKSQDMRSIMDNLSFIMEDISRNIRTGRGYISDNPNGVSSSISFTAATTPPQSWTYEISSGDILRTIDGDTVPLDSEDIIIDTDASGFIVTGAESPDDGNFEQPFVTIKLVGEIDYKGTITPFSLQTSVSQRQIDI